MAQYGQTLVDVVGSIRQIKPNCPPTMCRDFINQRVRTVQDFRPFWSWMLKSGILSVPDAYSTGTVAVAAGSRVVTGSSTAWPTDDLVNTTVSAAITEPGLQYIRPVSMSGIEEDVTLLVGAGTANEEVVSVAEVRGNSFRASFDKPHDAGFTVDASSLSGRQLRLGPEYPTFTISHVNSATQLVVDMPWAGASIASSGYTVLKMYYTIAHDIKDLMWVYDPVRSCDLDIHYSQELLNAQDPQRTQSGDPRIISDFRPNAGYSMLYELYHPQTSARQLPFLYARQWPELRRNNDRLPPFINPNVFIYGAYSQALRTRVEANDPFYDPVSANFYEQKAMAELEAAANADDSKCQQALSWERSRVGGSGNSWAQEHAVSVDDFGGRWY